MQLVKLIENSADATSEVAQPQRSPARERLKQVLDDISRLQREVEEAAKPVERLEAVIEAHRSARWRYDHARAVDRLRLRPAIERGDEPGAAVSPETLEAQRDAEATAETAAASEEGLSSASAAHRQAIERLTAAIGQRHAAELEVKYETDLERIGSDLVPAAIALRAIQTWFGGELNDWRSCSL